MRGGIAERGGVRVGHRIIEINGQSVVATAHEKIVQALSNSVGEVRLSGPTPVIFLRPSWSLGHWAHRLQGRCLTPGGCEVPGKPLALQRKPSLLGRACPAGWRARPLTSEPPRPGGLRPS